MMMMEIAARHAWTDGLLSCSCPSRPMRLRIRKMAGSVFVSSSFCLGHKYILVHDLLLTFFDQYLVNRHSFIVRHFFFFSVRFLGGDGIEEEGGREGNKEETQGLGRERDERRSREESDVCAAASKFVSASPANILSAWSPTTLDILLLHEQILTNILFVC